MNVEEQSVALYKAYPRKVARGAAIRAIKRALRKEGFEVLMEAVTEYAKAREGQDRQFTPYPATWFNQERWEDDREEWTPFTLSVPAEEAWESARSAVREFGTMGVSEARGLLPTSIMQSLEKVGWRNVCDMTEFNSGKLYNQFRSVYERLASCQDPKGTR